MSYSPTNWVNLSTKLGPTNLNKLENGLQAAAGVADSATASAAAASSAAATAAAAAAAAQATANAALPTPAGSNGQFLKRVGGLWVPTSFAASDIPSYPSDATKFLAGDGSWVVPAGSGGGGATSGLLSAIPSAATSSGKFFWATDQAAMYLSDGANWIRVSDPAGKTSLWFSATPPTGYVIYDGGTLGGSTGIYADLYAHLGSTTTLPDTRGRMPVGLGVHADVDTIGDTEGASSASVRRPKHRTTDAKSVSVSDPGHRHPMYHTANAGGVLGFPPDSGGHLEGPWGETDQYDAGTGAVTSTVTGIGVSLGGSIGTNNANDPLDTSPFIVFALIAKL